MLPGIRKGSRVALHWNWPAVELTAEQATALEHYTRLSLAMVNEVLWR